MSEKIKHECGIAMLRLRKPLSYYIEKYGTPMYAANKLYLLMEKQHNRGQDGAGVANIKIGLDPGKRYISRYRSIDREPIKGIFSKIGKKYKKAKKSGGTKNYLDGDWMKENVAFTGEVWLGHLRYGTHGKNSIETCHPFLRQNNWRSRNLVMAGNFNLTNVDELFEILMGMGQHPKEKTDTVTVMEKIGHFMDMETQMLFNRFKKNNSNQDITDHIESEFNIHKVLKRSCKDFDGGFAMAGILGFGGAFVARDPSGIRPAYYYADEEIVVVTSERPAIQTAFNVKHDDIKEVPPGHALIIDKKGDYSIKKYVEPLPKKACSFERIYFSRGTDPEIYQERKMLGKLLVPQIMESIDWDFKNVVFSYIPQTAETCFLGMVSGLEEHLVEEKKKILKGGGIDWHNIEELMTFSHRVEKLVIKDAKLRTFITEDSQRDEMVSHVYDTTYGVIKEGVDSVVVIDDSIVRGTTLEKSIIRMLDRLHPKKIVIVSSAPQIRYPDCYGIDMSRMKDFIAFRALLALLKDHGKEDLLQVVYEKCKVSLEKKEFVNHVKELYAQFTDVEISNKIGELVTGADIKAEVQIIYQTVDNLHTAIPDHTGDWYFTGDFPTPGGMRVVNQSFVNFMEGNSKRAY